MDSDLQWIWTWISVIFSTLFDGTFIFIYSWNVELQSLFSRQGVDQRSVVDEGGVVDSGGRVGVGDTGGEDGGVSLSLAETVLDQSAGAHSQSSSVGVLLLVESRSRQESRNLVDSALEVTIVSSLGLVSSDSNRNRVTSGHDLGAEGEWLDSGEDIGESMVGSVGVGQQLGVS